MEGDVHGVRLCGEDWRHEVIGMSWSYTSGVATAPVHQGCPVPVYDFDIVAWAGGRVRWIINLKVGELQPQHLPTLCLYRICPLKVVRITLGVVWRDEDTCVVIAVFRVELDKENIYDLYFKITHPRCRSRQQGRVKTYHARVRLQWSSQGHKQGGSKVHLGIRRSSSVRQK